MQPSRGATGGLGGSATSRQSTVTRAWRSARTGPAGGGWGRGTDGGGGSSAENKGEGKGGRGGTGPGGGAGIATPFVVGQTPLPPGHDAGRAAFDRGVEGADPGAIRNGVIPATAGLEAVAAGGAKYLVTEQLAATMGVSPEGASNLVRPVADTS